MAEIVLGAGIMLFGILVGAAIGISKSQSTK